MGIKINNLTDNEVDQKRLEQIITEVLKGEEIKEEKDLSLAIIGPGRMRKINGKYKGKNKVTDVLSFPESEIRLEQFETGPLEQSQSLGEIIICLSRVKKNAKRFDSELGQELARVLIHGTLHLLGYEHQGGGEEAREMEAKENYYLSVVQAKL